MSSPRTSVLRAVIRFLRGLKGPAGIVVHDEATHAHATFHLPQSLVETVEEHAPPRTDGPVRPPDGGTLNEMERCIIEALGAETLTGEQLAQRSGYPHDSRFRHVLASLRRRGVLLNLCPGYRLADQTKWAE